MNEQAEETVGGDSFVALRGVLEAGYRLVGQLDSELSRHHSIGYADFELLLELSVAPDRSMRLSDLAELALLSKSALSRRIDSLVRLGWVKREGCPTDKRGTYAVLTDSGMEKVAESISTHNDVLRQILSNRISCDELTSLIGLLDRLSAPAE